MIRRWGHGHSIAAGTVGSAVFVSDHLLWALTLCFLAGLALGRGWGAVGPALRRLGGPLAHRALLERERWLEVRARRRQQLERSRSLRRERDAEELKAYWRGVRDGTPEQGWPS